MIPRILAAVDGSEPASRAVALGADLAVKYGAALHLVHVSARLELRPELRECARVERGETPLAMELVDVGQAIVAGGRDPADALLGYARDLGIDLVVMEPPRRRADPRAPGGQRVAEGEQPGRVSRATGR